MGRSPGKSVVGLDIQPGSITAVEGSGQDVSVQRAATCELAPSIVRDGEVLDVGGLATALKALFAENKLGHRVRLGVANQRIVVRTLDLPPMSDDKEIASAVRFQAQEHIPMPLDQAVLEHHSLGVVETADGPRTRVVLVAARRDMIERLLEATRKAGLQASGIDLAAFAMIRALHHPGDTGGVLYINVGGITNIAVADGLTCVFTRVIVHGTESMAAELAERRALTIEHAHGWLKHVGLVAEIDQLDGDKEILAEARTILIEGVRRIADEVRNSIDFHTMQEGTVRVERAVLAGQAVAIDGFCDALAAQIGLPLKIGVVREGRAGACAGLAPGSLAIAAGLTVEEAVA